MNKALPLSSWIVEK